MCYNKGVTDKNRAFDAVGCVRFWLAWGVAVLSGTKL